jgi:hypothetical protein
MAEWQWVLGGNARDGFGPQRAMTSAKGRRITWRVDAACDAQFSVSALSDDAAAIQLLETDLYVYRDGVFMFRGRVCGVQGQLNENEHVLQFNVIDYRGMLNRRIAGVNGIAYTATDQSTIAWGLVTAAQTPSGGDWGITNGLGSGLTGQLRDKTLDPGKPIGDALGEMGRLENGFEWEIDANLAFNRWYPLRGNVNNKIWDYGGIVKSVGYTFNPDDFANSVLTSGSETTLPVAATNADVGTDVRGLWERPLGYPSIVDQATLNDRAPWALGQLNRIRFSYHVSLTSGRWDGMNDVWIGDTVIPNFQSGWLQQYSLGHRVVELQVVLDGNGGEAVDAGLLVTPT